jgi:integrase
MPTTLTDAILRNMKPPAAGRIELSDATCRGLRFRITSASDRSFSFRFGRGERVPIGDYPDVSLRDARMKADDLRRQVAAGKNPAHHRRGASERTFAGLAARYLREHAERHKRTAPADKQALAKHVLPTWGKRDFEALGRADLIKLVEKIIAAGTPVTANRVHSLISSIYSFAVDADLVKANPFLRLRKRGTERVKTRVLSDDEIRLFWDRAVLPPVSKATGIALRLALVLGCRAGEVAGLQRGEIGFDRQGRPTSWTIPADRSKNRRAHYLPLPPLAADLIGEALALSGDSEAVFASRTRGGSIAGHAVTVAMRRLGAAVPKSAGAEAWRANPPTAHDLRRTAATRLAQAGFPAEDVSAILNHSPAGITKKHYDLYERTTEKTKALGRWSQILKAIINPPAPNVVALKA